MEGPGIGAGVRDKGRVGGGGGGINLGQNLMGWWLKDRTNQWISH